MGRPAIVAGGDDDGSVGEVPRLMRVKVCCIGSIEEARLAIELGASALGLVSAMPSGPGVIDEEEIARIAAAVPPGVSTFLLTSRTTVETIVEQQRRCRPDTLQLVDRIEPGGHRRLRRLLPGVRLVQVVHVTGEEALAEARQAAPDVDALLLDSGDPGRAVKELGGTGRVHDWSISRRIRKQADVPVFLAGGLRADNLAAAAEAVVPWGVDVCSGVRVDGRLDRGELSRFMDVARRCR